MNIHELNLIIDIITDLYTDIMHYFINLFKFWDLIKLNFINYNRNIIN